MQIYVSMNIIRQVESILPLIGILVAGQIVVAWILL